MDGTGDHHVKLHIFPHMWKLGLKVKCIHKYICDLTYIYIYHDYNNGIFRGLGEGRRG
jgi:hypothetical protein